MEENNDREELAKEMTKILEETAKKAGVKLGKCIICGNKLMRDEKGDLIYSPFYCEDCIEDMRNKNMTPKEYAKKFHNVDLDQPT